MAKRDRTHGGMVSASFVRRYLHAQDMLMDGALGAYLDELMTFRVDRAIKRARANRRTVVKPLDFDM